MTKPFIKYVGGKTRLLPELRARMPRSYKRYFEPFIGGGSLFFDQAPAHAVIGDMNETLIDTYHALALDVDGVIEALEFHRAAHGNEKYYYEVRDMWNDGAWSGEDAITGRAATFIYLNKTCFNGLWRVNRSGKFNTPKGDYVEPKIFDPEHLRKVGEVLATTTVIHGSYLVTADASDPGDFVYMDPPYDPHSETSNFTSYTKEAFGREQQRELAVFARKLKDRGVQVMLSNNDTPFVRSLYSDFCIDNVKCGRSINSKGNKRGALDEVIISTYNATN